MLSAATQRFSRHPTQPRSDPVPPAADASSSTAQRRLSRITPSEFDSLLLHQDTKRATTGIDESQLGATPSGDSPRRTASISSTSTSNDQLAVDGEKQLSPTTPDSLKRRSMFRSVGNASSPDLASLVRKARENGRVSTDDAERQEVLDDDDQALWTDVHDDADPAPEMPYDVESPTKQRVSSRAPSPSPVLAAAPPTPSPPTEASPTFSSPRSQRSRSTTSPEISLSEFVRPSTPPPPTSSARSTFPTAPPSDPPFPFVRGRTSNLSAGSSNGSYVHVPFPAASRSASSGGLSTMTDDSPRSLSSTVQAMKKERQQSHLSAGGGLGLDATLSKPSNASSTSLVSGFGLGFGDLTSPRRKRTTTNEGAGDQLGQGDDGKLSISNTMKKTSRFFRKFGGGGGNGLPNVNKPLAAPTASKAPSLPPPVPPIPATFTSPSRPQSSDDRLLSAPNAAIDPSATPRASSSTAFGTLEPARSMSPSGRSPVSNASTATLSKATSPGSAGQVSAETMTRQGSNQSIDSSVSGSPRSPRRRSLSLNSISMSNASASPENVNKSRSRGGGGAGGGSASRASISRDRDKVVGYATGPRGEDDRLRHELRMWRLGVDGVLGAAGTSTSPTLNGGDDGARKTRASPSLSSVGFAGQPTLATIAGRRPSLPEGKDARNRTEAPRMGRNASLPVSRDEQERRTLSTQDAPSIRLVSPGRVSSNPGASDDVRSPSSTTSSIDSTSTFTAASTKRQTLVLSPDDVLAAIPEGTHSRENSAATMARQPSPSRSPASSPQFSSSPTFATTPTPPVSPPLPMSPPLMPTPSPGLGGGARSKNSRVSIVGYPSSSLASRSAVTSPTPTSASSTTSLQSTLSPSSMRRARPLDTPEIGENLSEEELDEKARTCAKRCWDEDETFLERRKIAEWLGSSHELNRHALRHYIDSFDFSDIRLDVAFRKLCGKLYLKAETQQVDRILEQFSRRYFEDNPKSVYASADVVHAVSYSLLLLNTDLHVVDSTSRMTRQQFIRNTLSAIHAQTGLEDAPPSAGTPSAEPFSPAMTDVDASTAGDGFSTMASEGSASRKSLERPRTAGNRSAVISPRPGTGSGDSPASSSINLGGGGGSPSQSRVALAQGGAGGFDSPGRALGLSQRSESALTVGSTHSNKSLEANLQAVLKDMYNAIRSQPIYQSSTGSNLNLPDSTGRPSLSLTPGNSPYATWSGNVSRTASRRSAASTSTAPSTYNKRSSVRGIGAFLGANSSLDLVRSSSPTPSTSTSLSDEQWSTAFGAATHHNVPTIGFANSLSHTIIREQQEDDTKSDTSSIHVTDEELALLGAPWAKEGILQRKHYWEFHGRRAKEKNWLKAFVVVSQGELKMFRFDGGGSSKKNAGGVGGGDWTSNASNVGSVSLIHALCSAMPPPGYSRDRPHCFVLTLPSGGSFFFQAGTPDLVAEWVSTCNYWSARLSKEPLSGGVSNVEYGWNKVDRLDGGDDDDDREEIASIRSGRSGHSRISYAGSAFHSAGVGSSLNVNDRISITDWKPPNVPLTPSTLAEEAQLEHLKRHVVIVQAELAHHNELRAPMTKLYSSRSSNYARALANWERKSQHLLAEIVKWSTYIDALTSAVRLRSIQRGKKEVEAMLKSADLDDEDDENDDDIVTRLSPFEAPPASMQNLFDSSK
ncbi:hypothetical protein JCM10212_001267 [Sporobolomyces blumeae]